VAWIPAPDATEEEAASTPKARPPAGRRLRGCNGARRLEEEEEAQQEETLSGSAKISCGICGEWFIGAPPAVFCDDCLKTPDDFFSLCRRLSVQTMAALLP